MPCTEIGLDTTNVGVELVANSLRHLGLTEVLLNDTRLSMRHLLLLCLCRHMRFILLFPDLLDIGNHELFPLFLLACPMVIKVVLSMRGM